MDEDGDLLLAGRVKNIINRGGEKISPEQVGAVLAGCRGVTEAAVYPVPDPLYGERVGAAVVVSRPDLVGSLPHTAKGALDRRAIRDRALADSQ